MNHYKSYDEEKFIVLTLNLAVRAVIYVSSAEVQEDEERDESKSR